MKRYCIVKPIDIINLNSTLGIVLLPMKYRVLNNFISSNICTFQIYSIRTSLTLGITNLQMLNRISERRWTSLVKRRNERIGHNCLAQRSVEIDYGRKDRVGISSLKYIKQIVEDQRCGSYLLLKMKADNRNRSSEPVNRSDS